jgi:hypothetical protein
MYYQQLSQEKLIVNTTYTSTHMLEQQGFSSAPVINPNTLLVTKTTGSFHSYTFVPGENLKTTPEPKDYSEGSKSSANNVLSA